MPLVELNDGSTVVFLAPGAGGDFEAQGVDIQEIKVKLSEVASKGADVIREAATAVKNALSAAAPSELEIEIGIVLSKEGSVIIASAKAEASLKIKAVWKHKNG